MTIAAASAPVTPARAGIREPSAYALEIRAWAHIDSAMPGIANKK